jgi:hypothetical protein
VTRAAGHGRRGMLCRAAAAEYLGGWLVINLAIQVTAISFVVGTIVFAVGCLLRWISGLLKPRKEK